MTVDNSTDPPTPSGTEGGHEGGDAPPSTPTVEPEGTSSPSTPPAPVAPKPLDAHSGSGDEIAKALNRQNEIFEAQSKSLKRIEDALYEEPDDDTPPTGAPEDATASIVTPEPPPQPTPEEPDEIVPQTPARSRWKKVW